MPYPDIKDSNAAFEMALLWYGWDILGAAIAFVWIFVFGVLGIREVWMSVLVTAMICVAIGCFAFYFYAAAIERQLRARRAKRNS